MQFLDYIKLSQSEKTTGLPVKVSMLTNFTDDVLKKLLIGMCRNDGIEPNIYQVPYKQYLFELKDPASGLMRQNAEVTFVCFDANPYLESEFSASGHGEGVIEDLSRYASSNTGHIVIQKFTNPAGVQHGRILKESALKLRVDALNAELQELANKYSHIHILDTEHLMRRLGEESSRDMRGLYAFDLPFSHDFLTMLAREWMVYVRLRTGKVRKCVVVDLDNTLWGGVVGETGPLGIDLGEEYPGNAYRAFQRTLLGLWEKGIILAINSRNNPDDVMEVFEKNPQMILQPKHFASIVANWKSKPENMREIANELNIGLDSMIFLDDDAMNRDMVRTQMPEVLVPEFSLPPEEYTRTLLNLDAFHVHDVTEEDKQRGDMYAQEHVRKIAQQEADTPEAYLQSLEIRLDVSINDASQKVRLAQLTQKTNQFNLTTRRYTEQEIMRMIDDGDRVYAGTVRDTFGPYGLTVLGIVRMSGEKPRLDTFLMSCRVMGRRVEDAFIQAISKDLLALGKVEISAEFISTAKNMPAADFLPHVGAEQVGLSTAGAIAYRLSLKTVLSHTKAAMPVHTTMLTV